MNKGDLVIYATTEGKYVDNQFNCPINKFAFLIGLNDLQATIIIKERSSYKIQKVLLCNLCELEELEGIKIATDMVYDREIKRLKGKLKSTKRSDYQHELKEKADEIEKTIKNLANNIAKENDSVNFENKIKELAQLKKQYFGIECDEVAIARKQNGSLNNLIRQMEKKKREANKEISDEILENINMQLV